jgi:hypothetical protein
MEVHHHPQVEKKNFKEYFLEFLMIFLAVTMGFFAENLREHYTEKTNTKEYLESYHDELLQQEKVFAVYKKLYQNKIVDCDSIKTIFFNSEENNKLNVLEDLFIPGLTLVEIPFNTSSYDQMVSSGALRYINDIALRDSMGAYRSVIEATKNYNANVEQSIVANTMEIAKLQDFHDIVSTDTATSYDLTHHIPQMKSFRILNDGQRGSLVFFYESYIIQAQSDLRRIRLLNTSNLILQKMVDNELNK